jgi:hypothetical protein
MKEKPKKERRFLKAIGRVGEILIQEVLIKIGSNLIKKIGGKKTLPSILFLLASLSLFAQYPNTGNKQRLGFQTTGDGLTWRGSESDTASIQPINNTSAWVILDTVNLKFYTFDFTSNVWNSVGGAAFTQPVDSLFFNTGVPTNNVETAKMRWDSDLATVVLGLNDNVPNELGFKNFWLVKNQTGATITKGSIVYANGTVGASGRITIDKFIADGSIDAKYLLGITAHDLSNGEDGYVISFGKIRKVNTDTFAAGAILYPSPTEAGVWTDVEPIAPNIDMPIGFCINSHANNGTIAIRVASGYKLHELHDLAISSPVEKASLYYSGGLWRDTTATLLLSDTASMLTPYFRDADTTSLNLTSRFAAKLNISDTASMLTNYLRTGVAASTYQTILTNPITGTGTLNYLPKFTGTSTLGSSGLFRDINRFSINEGTDQSFGWDFMGNTSNPFIGNNVKTSTTFERVERMASTTLFNPAAIIFGYQRVNNSSLAVSFGGMNFMTTSGNLAGDINPITYSRMFIEPDGNIGIGTMQPSYKFDIRGTLGVTGETTLSAPLTVNSSAVFNEGSTDSDFRVESDGNANMVFVDASTDRVGIGYASPTKTLDVNGEVRINTVTATPTSLLGKDGSNVVGEVTDINQSGVMKVGGTTATTNSVGGINVAHGLSYTPSKVIATIAQLNSYVIVVRGITSTNLEFTVYDSTTGVGLDTVSVGFYWIAFK